MQLENKNIYCVIFNSHDIMKFLEQATYILRKNNQKITNTRLWLLQEFNNSHTTLTPYEILQNNPQASIDITTIYRNFELFESL